MPIIAVHIAPARTRLQEATFLVPRALLVPAVVGPVLLLRPRMIALGALLLAAVCGVFLAQRVAHGDVVHPIVTGLIVVAIGWRFRAQLTLAR